MKYGWKPDPYDCNDLHFHVSAPVAVPPKYSLVSKMPRAYDQLSIGSCTSNAIAGLVEYLEIKLKRPQYTPSRLFIYFYERYLEGTINEDSGAAIRDGMKVVATNGAPHENLWPYIVGNFRTTPPITCYKDGIKHRVHEYSRVTQSLNKMKECIAADFPFVFGFRVFSSFESLAVTLTGIVPMPGPFEREVGGHAVVACGYDDDTQMFDVRNSWGENWGLHGYCKMPYAYLTNPQLTSDLWTAHLVV